MKLSVEPREKAVMKELRSELARQYQHLSEDGDCYCKISDGAVWVEEYYPSWTACEGEVKEYLTEEPAEYCVHVYSYALGPKRDHEFVSEQLIQALRAALAEVKRWRRD